MRILFFLLGLLFCLSAFGQNKKKQTGWLFYWGGAVVWFSDEISSTTETQYFFDNKSKYGKGLKVNYIPDALFFKSIAKGYRITDIFLNGSPTINNKPIEDDSIWVIPVKGNYVSNTMPISGLSPIDTLRFKTHSKTMTVTYSFEANYEISGLELLKKSDKRKLKRVKYYVVYPPH